MQHSKLENDFAAFVLARESEVSALLAEKAKLEFNIAHLEQSCRSIALDIVEKARVFALKDDRRIWDDKTHESYQFEIDARDEKVVWCIGKMSAALVQAYEHVQNLEREVSIFPHKLNLAELKCARLMEGQAHAAANMSRKDSELTAMSQRLKGILHEVESYSIKYNLLEKKCAELEEESAVNKKLYEVSVMELEAYKASDIRQIDSRIHFLKSKLADEEHKNATLMLASEDHVKEMAAKSAAFCILQDQNKELKLSVSGAAHQMRLLEDEIQALQNSILEQKLAHDVEIASLRAQSKRELSALETKLAQNSLQ